MADREELPEGYFATPHNPTFRELAHAMVQRSGPDSWRDLVRLVGNVHRAARKGNPPVPQTADARIGPALLAALGFTVRKRDKITGEEFPEVEALPNTDPCDAHLDEVLAAMGLGVIIGPWREVSKLADEAGVHAIGGPGVGRKSVTAHPEGCPYHVPLEQLGQKELSELYREHDRLRDRALEAADDLPPDLARRVKDLIRGMDAAIQEKRGKGPAGKIGPGDILDVDVKDVASALLKDMGIKESPAAPDAERNDKGEGPEGADEEGGAA